MKLLTALLISLVTGQLFVQPAVTDLANAELITVQPTVKVKGFAAKSEQTEIEFCDDGSCFPPTKPEGKLVYIGLRFLDSLETFLENNQLDYYTTVNGELNVYDGIHVIKTTDLGDNKKLLPYLQGIATSNTIYPTKARITLPYLTEELFTDWLTEAVKKFNKVIISVQSANVISNDHKTLIENNKGKISFEVSETEVVSLKGSFPEISCYISSRTESKKEDIFSTAVDVCEAASQAPAASN
ncbi:hypothetical protein DSO57_1037684 [Entomophthora muscae]|uniref:Uncharacterized protein n=2 Tax=Entomophthora muscae TaxID=34485 RepID=A0ACC2RI83_9FUNG|nr:hypothetical protein DSO57_1022049 [Entomophthora muscae]KAJ9083141.1 hypothetical protein DSO57_1037684 [Entomophthora muscae]